MSADQDQPGDGPMVWDMPKVKRWVADGMKVDSPNVIDAYTLQRMEADGLVQLDAVRAGGKPARLLVTITALGEFEVERLEAIERAQADAGGEPA